MKRFARANFSIVLTGLLLFLNTGCDDYFELKRPPESPWQTVDEFDRAIIGAYGVLFASHEWVQAWPNYAVSLTSFGDDVEWVRDNQWNYWRVTDQGFNSVELTERLWWLTYRGIGTINDALDFVERHDGNPFPDATSTEIDHGLNRVVGELHFLRGFSYYMLQTLFGHAYEPGGSNSSADIPLVLNFATSGEAATNPKIGTTQEIWDQILLDLQMAKDLLPEQYDRSLHPAAFEVRANRFAASAMLMRVYFQRGEYELAELEADYILEEGSAHYNLNEDPIEAFNKSGILERGAETIWYLPYSDLSLYPANHMSVMNAFWNGNKCTWSETRMAGKTIQRLGWKDDPYVENDTSFNDIAYYDKRFTQLMLIRYPVDMMFGILDERGYESDFSLGSDAGIAAFETEINKMNNDLGTNFQYDSREEIQNLATVWPNKYYRGPTDDFTNIPLIRLAEVYLTRSVIRYRNGDLAGAAQDLNTVKERAWDADAAGMAYQPITAGEINEDLINDERLIELWNEADRLNYLRGLKVDIPQGERGDGSDSYLSDIFIYPLPQGESIYLTGPD